MLGNAVYLFAAVLLMAPASYSLELRRIPLRMSTAVSAPVKVQLSTAPGTPVAVLKVPSNAWKWPSSWPFPKDFMERTKVTESMHDHSLERLQRLNEVFISFVAAAHPSEQLASLVISADEKEDHMSPYAHLPLSACCGTTVNFPFQSRSFDRVIFLSGIAQVENPIEVFQEIWRVLKPNGSGFACFTNQASRLRTSGPLKMWHTMNDEQKMWIAGSYFHYSAFEGWNNLEGYDLMGTSGDKSLQFDSTNSKNQTAYVVMARKATNPPDISSDLADETQDGTPEAILARLMGLRRASMHDKKSLARRLTAVVRSGISEHAVNSLLESLDPAVPDIYTVLSEVDDAVIPVTAKSLLCSLILPKWTGSAAQVAGLRAGLGLAPAPERVSAFWTRLGGLTHALSAKDKLYLLADMVPVFDHSDHESLLGAAADALEEVQMILMQRLAPSVPRAALESFSVDLLLSDFLGVFSASSRTLEQHRRCLLQYVQNVPEQELTTAVTELAAQPQPFPATRSTEQ